MRTWRGLAVATALLLVVAACGDDDSGSDASTTTAASSEETTTTAAAEESTTTTAATATTTTAAGSSDEPVEIRWYIGLGAGGQPEQRDAQLAVIDAFNASQSGIVLVPEIVENEVAFETLATQIASGNAPDIIGPVGRDGSNAFAGLYLDIEPLVAASGLDLSIWSGAAVDGQREGDGTLVGLPFASFPSAIYFSRDLFDEAGLPYPPQEYGPDGLATYGEGTEWEGLWDYEKVAEIGRILSVDANGVDGTDASFDTENTVQWGFVWQWTDRLFQQGTFWGGGYPLADDGTADIPQAWEDEWAWYHNAVWVDGFAPSQSELDALGNAFQSGNVAMAGTHLWYTCCIRDDANELPGDFWDYAVMPSYNGTVTANLHADTFRILGDTDHPAEAFTVLEYLVTTAALDLLTAYGAAPADLSLTDDFVAALEERYPQGVNWDVVLNSAAFADVPSHETFLPGWEPYKERMDVLKSALLTDASLDLGAAIAELEADLTAIFQENA